MNVLQIMIFYYEKDLETSIYLTFLYSQFFQFDYYEVQETLNFYSNSNFKFYRWHSMISIT